jgi:KDO2-lipid IV(A) lauroyltransferase
VKSIRKTIKRLRHRIEFGCMQAVTFGLCRVSHRHVLAAADVLGWIAFVVVRVRRKVVLQNLAMAFPEKSESERLGIALRCYQNFTKMVFEYVRFPVMQKDDVLSLCELAGKPDADAVLKGGKGGVLVAGHFGNWELMGAYLAQAGYPISFLVGEQHNPWVDEVMNRNRIFMGIRIIHRGVAVRGVIRALRDNGFVAMLSDQDAGKEGVFVDFFGRPASTHQGPAVFALRTGAPILFGSAVRLPEGRMRIEAHALRFDGLSGITPENIRTVTQAYTALLEAAVRAHPDHWFWMHRRWKTRPTDEPASPST